MRSHWGLVLAAMVTVTAGLAGCSGTETKPEHQLILKPMPALAPPASPAKPAPITEFGDGTYEVGVDIKPGRYKTPGGPGDGTVKCYWARLADFAGNRLSAKAVGYGDKGPQVVTIDAADKGFETRACGVWTLSQ